MGLQGAAYVGCCSMRLDGRVGFTRVRAPYVRDEDVAAVCRQYEHLTVPLEDLSPRPLRVVPEEAVTVARATEDVAA
jgi:DNA segregation ATPase FtsK/SpoIIIE, S-DNA-T family